MDSGAESYRRFLQGDEQGLVEIIRDHKDALTLYLNSIVRDMTAAEELTEDVFVRLFVKRPRFSGRSSFKTWLFAVGRNAALDFLRRRSGSRTVPLDEAGELASEEASLEAACIRVEDSERVRRALRRLSRDQRQALWLVYFEDMSHKEAAFVMKKSVHAMDALVSRARQALRAELDKEEI